MNFSRKLNALFNGRHLESPSWLLSMILILFTASFLFLLLAPQDTQAHPFFNSSEPGCDGTDSFVLFCEDFETPDAAGGRWYGEDCDTAKTNGGIANRTKGWCGTIYANPITPAGAASSGKGLGGSWAGDHGQLDGSRNDRNMADHGFAPNHSTYNEIFVRYYQKFDTGYSFGAEKVLTFNEVPGSGGIKFGNLHLNCGGGGGATGMLHWQPKGTGGPCMNILQLSSGRYYAIQVHAKKGGGDILEVWVDDCGADGLSCPATPTKRLTVNNMSWPSGQFGSLWWENWANPTSAGRSYIDNIKVSQVGPIGFVSAAPPGGGDTTPPAAPTNLQVQ